MNQNIGQYLNSCNTIHGYSDQEQTGLKTDAFGHNEVSNIMSLLGVQFGESFRGNFHNIIQYNTSQDIATHPNDDVIFRKYIY